MNKPIVTMIFEGYLAKHTTDEYNVRTEYRHISRC